MTRSLPTLSPASLETSPTGLPLCPTCGRLASQHTNPGPEVGDWRNLDPRHVARARELLTDR